jgi:hypothetical protein
MGKRKQQLKKFNSNLDTSLERVNLQVIMASSPPANVPLYSVSVDTGNAPLEHSVVIQSASVGKQVETSMQ